MTNNAEWRFFRRNPKGWAAFIAQQRYHFAHVAQLHHAHDALLSNKCGASSGENETSTDPGFGQCFIDKTAEAIFSLISRFVID